MCPTCPICKQLFKKVKIVGGAPYDVLFYDKYAHEYDSEVEDDERIYDVDDEGYDNAMTMTMTTRLFICHLV